MGRGQRGTECGQTEDCSTTEWGGRDSKEEETGWMEDGEGVMTGGRKRVGVEKGTEGRGEVRKRGDGKCTREEILTWLCLEN